MPSVKKLTASSVTETDNDESILEIDTSSETTDTNNKRLISGSGNSTPAKKVRSKPQPQIVENMKEYFDSNTLDQLTTTTLRHWLKERSLPCTTREKKENLIQKVRKHFLEGTL